MPIHTVKASRYYRLRMLMSLESLKLLSRSREINSETRKRLTITPVAPRLLLAIANQHNDLQWWLLYYADTSPKQRKLTRLCSKLSLYRVLWLADRDSGMRFPGNWELMLFTYLLIYHLFLLTTYVFILFFLILPLYIAYECCHSFCFRNRNALLSDVKLYCLNTVGSRDHSPLSAHTVPACWNTSWPARQSGYCGETRKEPPEADLVRDGRKAGKGTESRKICRVLCTNSGPLLFCTLKQLNYF